MRYSGLRFWPRCQGWPAARDGAPDRPPCCQPDGMEVIHDHGGMAQRGNQRAGVATPWVSTTVAMRASQASERAPSQLSTAALVRSATRSCSRPRSRSIRPGDPSGGRQAGRLEDAGLIQPKRGHTVQARRVLHQRPTMVAHRSHDGRPANPKSRVTAATAWASFRPGVSLLLDIRHPQDMCKICEAPGAVSSPTAPSTASLHAPRRRANILLQASQAAGRNP
jgi:hypothetical protein